MIMNLLNFEMIYLPICTCIDQSVFVCVIKRVMSLCIGVKSSVFEGAIEPCGRPLRVDGRMWPEAEEWPNLSGSDVLTSFSSFSS